MPDDNQQDPITPSETPVSEENPVSPDIAESIPATTSEPSDMPLEAPEAPEEGFTPPLVNNDNSPRSGQIQFL